MQTVARYYRRITPEIRRRLVLDSAAANKGLQTNKENTHCRNNKGNIRKPVLPAGDSPAACQRADPLLAFEQQQQQLLLPSLCKICLGVLGRHVTELVHQLDGQLDFLAPDIKAALLAVARRRGELSRAVLAALSDESWRQLDLAGCSRLFAADIIAVAARMPNLQVLDVSGCERLAAGGWRQLASAWPHLTVIRLGGSGLQLGGDEGGAADWEEAFASDDEGAADKVASPAVGSAARAAGRQLSPGSSGSSSSEPFNPGVTSAAARQAAGVSSSKPQSIRLKQLRVLVWPDVPAAAVELVQQRCPRVLINPVMRCDPVTGRLPPRELDGSRPLDEPFMELVGHEALLGISPEGQQQQQQGGIVHIAEKFRVAYVQQAARLKEKERRMRVNEQKRQLKASHALRTLNAWLDEPA
eukprot:gene11201-11351_t